MRPTQTLRMKSVMYLNIRAYVYLSIDACMHEPVCMYFRMSVSLCLSVSLSLCLSVSLSLCLSVSLSLCLSLSLSLPGERQGQRSGPHPARVRTPAALGGICFPRRIFSRGLSCTARNLQQVLSLCLSPSVCPSGCPSVCLGTPLHVCIRISLCFYHQACEASPPLAEAWTPTV